MLSAVAGLVLALSFSTTSGASAVTGIVVDASGRPIPRAVVRVMAADGNTASTTFTGVDGAFRVADAPDGCRVEAALPGFVAASAACGDHLTLTLAIAPISDAIVVSATRTDAPASQVGASVSVFDAQEIAGRQQPLLADLLRDAPGTSVIRTGAPGGVTSLFIRGGESNYTKVLLDGVPLNEPGGGFDLSNITTENLDRVEVVRGANSALFGSDAMSGVIQLFTRRATSAQPDVHLFTEGGSFATGRVSAGIAAKAGRVDYSADGAGLTTDNQSPNDQFKDATASGTAGIDLGRGALLRVVGRLERGHAGTPGQTAFGRPDLDAFYARHDTVAGVTFEDHRGMVEQRASYGLAISQQTSADLKIDPDYTPSFNGATAPFAFSDFPFESQTDLRRHRASYQIDDTFSTARAGTHVDTALVDWDGERATLTDVLDATVIKAARDNFGVSLQHQALFGRAFLTAGVRLEHNASFGNAVTPRVSAAWYLRTGSGAIGATRVSVNAGTAIKEPTIDQSFSPSPFFLGNPNLQPERARDLDAGVEQRFAGDRLRLAATWFDNRYRNIIATDTLSFDPFVAQYFNIGLTRARGAELSGDVALVSGLRVKAGYTFDASRILESTSPSDPVFTPGNPAFRRPRHAGFFDVAWSRARATASLTGTLVGRRSDSDFSSLDPALLVNPGYQQWDARAAVRIWSRVWLTGAIDNMANRHYLEPLGYPALGRAVRGGVRLRF